MSLQLLVSMAGGIQLANLDNGKPVARPGRKAMGLFSKASIRCREIAKPPKDGIRLYSFT
jgi:hypothetical protein